MNSSRILEKLNFSSKIVLVTGGSRGIGEAIARGFAELGAEVIITARNYEPLKSVADDIVGQGGKAYPIVCHRARAEEVGKLFEEIKSRYGKLDVLVNNSATNPYFGPILEATEAVFDKTFEVNCKGYFLMSQQAGKMMVQQSSGCIINIASIEGIHPSPFMGIYSMTKSAVIMLTKVLAKELGPAGIRVNAVCPGLTETKFASVLVNTPEIRERYVQSTPLGRHAQPNEMVGAVIYLASDLASYTNGAVIICDGGKTV
ncbi:MAG: glucose 1-dehydrogenase [Candidatus Hydrogenedentes bacterium]|nr:glucose 1-dehydrogenase [Candidatus Hydrogenedentota bacterium]